MTVAIQLSADELEGTKASISTLVVAVGDRVTEGDVLMELETDKVSMEVCAPASGVIKSLNVNVGDELEPDMVMGYISQETETENSSQATTETENTQEPIVESAASTSNEPLSDAMHDRLSPAVRRLVTEHSLTIADIKGSGKQGRITRKDIDEHLAQLAANPVTPPAGTPLGTPSGNKVVSQPDRAMPKTDYPQLNIESVTKPHSRIRKTIAEHMVTSLLHTAPHVTSVFEVDMSHVIEHRKWHKKSCERLGFPLTFSAYFAYAIAAAVKTVPEVNSRFHTDHLEIFQQVNLGVGTALGHKGLVVPVIRGIDSMQLYDLANALAKQTTKARDGKLTPDDLKGSTITISNHGVSGSLFATPIVINQPEVAIVGIGKLEKRAVVREVNGEDQIQIRPMCYVSLTIDHRALDAYQTNLFLSHFVQILENWEG